jgi:glycosyltransferase involved in cell wall biosynthesis
MHDIQHVHYPEFLSWHRRLSRGITYGLSASHADYFQASSQFIREDMLAHYPQISAEQIEVIPEGVNAEDFAVRRDLVELIARYQLDAKFLFFPAQLWPHKNHLRVLRAFKQIERQFGVKIPLIMTGAAYSAAGDVLRFLVDQDMPYVRYLGRVPFDDLVGLYQSAAFLLSPGLYESNSLPVLEAAAAGTPVIASLIPPNQELQEKLQLNLFDPLSESELSELILRLWHDEKTGISQAAHNREAVSEFSWKNAASSYLAIFKRVTQPAA